MHVYGKQCLIWVFRLGHTLYMGRFHTECGVIMPATGTNSLGNLALSLWLPRWWWPLKSYTVLNQPESWAELSEEWKTDVCSSNYTCLSCSLRRVAVRACWTMKYIEKEQRFKDISSLCDLYSLYVCAIQLFFLISLLHLYVDSASFKYGRGLAAHHFLCLISFPLYHKTCFNVSWMYM